MINCTDTLDIVESITLAPTFQVFPGFQLVVTLPQHAYELQVELRVRGERLDRQYAALWEQERRLVTEQNRPMDDRIYEEIETKLGLIRYEMTRILDEFDQDSNSEADDDFSDRSAYNFPPLVVGSGSICGL